MWKQKVSRNLPPEIRDVAGNVYNKLERGAQESNLGALHNLRRCQKCHSASKAHFSSKPGHHWRNRKSRRLPPLRVSQLGNFGGEELRRNNQSLTAGEMQKSFHIRECYPNFRPSRTQDLRQSEGLVINIQSSCTSTPV